MRAFNNTLGWPCTGPAKAKKPHHAEQVEELRPPVMPAIGSSWPWPTCNWANQEEAQQWHDKAVAWTQTNKPDDADLHRFQAEAAALLGATLPAVEPAPEPTAKVEEAKELPTSTAAPEPAKEEEKPQ